MNWFIVIPVALAVLGTAIALVCIRRHEREREQIVMRVRTTGMGTMYELSYRLKFKRGMSEKAFIDELRCRNGNLNIVCGRESDKDML